MFENASKLQWVFQMVGRWIGLDLFHEDVGAAHADEIFLMFNAHEFPWQSVYSEGDKKTSRNLIKLWTNFAKFHNPTPQKDDFDGVSWGR